MSLGTLVVIVLLGQSVHAQNMLRFACSQLTIERADPLVSPGQSPAPHTHQIIGGNSFNLTVRRTTFFREFQLTLLRWNQVFMIQPLSRLAQAAHIRRISVTTGPRLYISNHLRMAPSNVLHSLPMLACSRMEE